MAAKRPPDEIQAEQIFVDLPPPEQTFVPSVQLEQREIKMTYISTSESVTETTSSSEHHVPSIVTNGNKGIVGKESVLGREGFSQEIISNSQYVQKSMATTKSRTTTTTEQSASQDLLSVEYKAQHSTQGTAHAEVMEFFEEQNKVFMEQSGVQHQKKARSPSPSPVRQSVGLDHLDNLVKLMEQMSNLRDENVKLKRKCAYLESAKTLLEVKTTLDHEVSIQSKSSSPSKSSAHRISRQRLPSAEDVCLDIDDTASDQSPKRPKHGIHKRSYSTGSLDIPSEIIEQTGEDEISEKLLSKSYEKGPKSIKGSKSPSAKRKSKMPHWGKFKIMGFSLKSIKDFGRGTNTGKELSVPGSALENRSVDSGVGSGVEADPGELPRKSTSSGEPSSPTGYTIAQVQKEPHEYDDFGGEIWMGDPEWLEKHEDEMTDAMFKKEVIVLNSAQKSEEGEYLQVPLPRRKSSPSLLEESPADMAVSTEYLNLRRTSSYKGRSSHGDLPEVKDIASPKSEKKVSTKSTWGKKVKHIVHTRKDSIKKRLIKKGFISDVDQSGGEDICEMNQDIEAFEEMRRMYLEQEGPLGRSTPKTSPLSIPRGSKSECGEDESWKPALKQLSSVDVEAMFGGMSDEFSKKMEQWEEKKSRTSSSAKADTSEGSEVIFPDNIGTISPEFQKKMDEWERSKSIKSGETSGKSIRVQRDSREGSPEGYSAGPDTTTQSVNVEELQRKLTESFNRKLTEWERRKYRRESGSPVFDRKDSTTKSITRKEDRQSSRKQKGDKDKGKLERRRERELQRVEREEQKLEKERIRIEKERLKALEREARIEKMKGRLSQPDMESKFKNPILSPLTEYKVTTDFARKLYEWELRKGGSSSSMSMATYLETQQRNMEQSGVSTEGAKKESFGDDAVFEGPEKLPKGQRPPPLTLQPCFDSPEETSPGDKSSDASFGDDTSLTTESMIDANITSTLEKANNEVMERLHDHEIEYEALQDEIRSLTDKLDKVKAHHSKEIGWPPGQTSPLPTDAITAQLSELESKIGELQNFGDNLAMSMESAAVCKWQSMEGQESVNQRLVDLLEQMRLMLLEASETEEAAQKSSALKNFEKLYRQAMQLQVQLSNLRLSQLERNKEIMTMKRHLLLQEANNLILQADIARRETELCKYKATSTKRPGGIKRWNTYGGMEGRVVESEEVNLVPPYKRFTKVRKSAVAHQEVVMETTETNTSVDTSKDEVSKDSSGELIDGKLSNMSTSFTDNSKDFSHLAADIDFIDECTPEIDHTEQIEKVETEDSIKVSHGQVVNIKQDKGVEISMTIKLPTANISLPRDISQQELMVPRSSRVLESSPPTDQKGHSEMLPSFKSEAKFPELLIPEWRKGSDKERHARLTKMRSIDIAESKELQGENSEIKQMEGSEESFISVSRSLEDTTEESSFDRDVFFNESVSTQQISNIQQRKLVHSAPMSQSGALGSYRTVLNVNSPTSLSPILPKRCTHPPAHWPRVRHVSSVHRIKPADELLEESRKYRKGHSVYMTRILQKYSDDVGSNLSNRKHGNKENIKEGYVKSIVKRLSRESTPEYNQRISKMSPKTLSSLSLQRTDSPKSKSEFVQNIVEKLSSSNRSNQRSRSLGSPLSDLTNGSGSKVRQLAEAFDSPRATPERALSDSEGQPSKSVVVSGRQVRDSWQDSSSTITSQTFINIDPCDIVKQDSSSVSFSSMPLLSVKEEGLSDSKNGYRDRAATTATCDNNGKGQGDKDLHEMRTRSDSGEIVSEEMVKTHISEQSHIPKSSKSKKVEIQVTPRKHKSGGRVKMGTIGVLCQQTMLSFDLGLTLQASEQEETTKLGESELSPLCASGSQTSSRPLSSSSSEGEKTPASPTEKSSRTKSKFFETSWLQKKFFKVSK